MDKDVTRPGRPKGSKDKTTPAAFVNRFKGKTMTNISRLLDQGDRETTLKCMSLIYGKSIPQPVINICKVEDVPSAKQATAQVIDYSARGVITTDQADRLINQISKYIDLTKLDELNSMLEKMEKSRADE